MALIKINIEQAVVSESAAKKPSYKVAKVGGAQTLVIPSDKKSDLQEVVNFLKSAKKAAVDGLNARVKAATAFTKANQTPKGPRKTALKETYKTEKAKSTKAIRTAKADLRMANKVAKKIGLGGLNLPFSASDIVASGPGLAKSLKTIRAIKLTEFGVTGKRGTFKPKFMKPETFEQIGVKTPKKPGNAAAIKRTKARMTDGGVGGAHTPAKAKALKKKREEQLGGKADAGLKKRADKKNAEWMNNSEIELSARADAKLGDKVQKRSKAILKTVGAKADFSKASGTITNSEGKSLGNGAGVVVTEMRHHFEDKKIPVVRKKDGFEIPGVISVTYNATGAKFKRLGK